MSYDPTTWLLGLAGGTAINPTRLNKLEQGVADAHTLIADLAEADHTHTSAQITDATANNTVDTIVKRDSTGAFAATAVNGLSTATSAAQAVPKSQLDSAVATLATSASVTDLDTRVTAVETDKADVAHTHPASDITDQVVIGDGVTDIVALTQVEYDAIVTPDAATLYLIVG